VNFVALGGKTALQFRKRGRSRQFNRFIEQFRHNISRFSGQHPAHCKVSARFLQNTERTVQRNQDKNTGKDKTLAGESHQSDQGLISEEGDHNIEEKKEADNKRRHGPGRSHI
jgi:hypothetical protein